MGRLLTYVAAAIPEGGAAVYSQIIGLSWSFCKEPAGHVFHLKALQQAGLHSKWSQQYCASMY